MRSVARDQLADLRVGDCEVIDGLLWVSRVGGSGRVAVSEDSRSIYGCQARAIEAIELNN